MYQLIYPSTYQRMGAELSPCERYRYRLWRGWNENRPATFIMLNPSTANAFDDDHTIRKCVGFAKRWGCGGVEVVNLFAWRSTDWKALKTAPNPVGPDNHRHIHDAVLRAGNDGCVVVAWGAHRPPGIDGEVAQLPRNFLGGYRCLGTAKDGSPRHPLMVSYAAPLQPWPPPQPPPSVPEGREP